MDAINMDAIKQKPVFLSGATGFIGQALYPVLKDAGFEVRCGTRSVDRARKDDPQRQWVEFDVERPKTLGPALEGCGSAFYLVHQMGSGPDYREREGWAALSFREAARRAGLQRIVYLGGVAPRGAASEHLKSRLETGEILRGGDISTIELRASMIIGANSASWNLVRDLAARLPLMLLPKWTQTKSQPVYIDDVRVALIAALILEEEDSKWFDIPGPEVLSVEEIMTRTAGQMGHRPRSFNVPFLSPRLSSYWLRLVTDGDLYLARQLVEGLKTDLVAVDDHFWERIDYTKERTGFDEAVRRALDESEPESMVARGYEWIAGKLADGASEG